MPQPAEVAQLVGGDGRREGNDIGGGVRRLGRPTKVLEGIDRRRAGRVQVAPVDLVGGAARVIAQRDAEAKRLIRPDAGLTWVNVKEKSA